MGGGGGGVTQPIVRYKEGKGRGSTAACCEDARRANGPIHGDQRRELRTRSMGSRGREATRGQGFPAKASMAMAQRTTRSHNSSDTCVRVNQGECRCS